MNQYSQGFAFMPVIFIVAVIVLVSGGAAFYTTQERTVPLIQPEQTFIEVVTPTPEPTPEPSAEPTLEITASPKADPTVKGATTVQLKVTEATPVPTPTPIIRDSKITTTPVLKQSESAEAGSSQPEEEESKDEPKKEETKPIGQMDALITIDSDIQPVPEEPISFEAPTTSMNELSPNDTPIQIDSDFDITN